MTPFEALSDRPPPTLRDYVTGSTSAAVLDDSLSHRLQFLQLLRENLTLEQLRIRSQGNNHCQDRSFAVGGWVWLRLKPYRQVSVLHHSPKLTKRFYGPFRITRVLGPVAYELLLPPDANFHPVFRISNPYPCSGFVHH